MLDIKDIYAGYLKKLNEENRINRYEDKESWFHASSSGMCMRKIYYNSVEQVEASPIDDNTLRLFRLGDLVHNDIQDALQLYAEKEKVDVLIEEEIRIQDINVRGFFDICIVDDDAMYDVKTCNSFKWRNLFGRTPDPEPAENYALQLGTYAYWYQQKYDVELQKLALLYYNKDTSLMREVNVPKSFIIKAYEYWKDVNERFKIGIPEVSLGTAPVYEWECNVKYCGYYNHCGGGLKGQSKWTKGR